VSLQRFKDFTASFTVVEKPAGVGWHGFSFAMGAVGAGEGGLKLYI